eukprot:TRINITY_DN486_c0_g1_i3.p1 TRINITY_DN486_c0_g1~~TRINITY_DN486_c0_g1_i3.p1  ORF type:complete len:968 (+),score=173.42 TRINITY_DN486_c0_g1_i3:60-2906(+)
MRERRNSPLESARSSTLIVIEPELNVLKEKDKELGKLESSWIIISCVAIMMSVVLVTLVYFESKQVHEPEEIFHKQEEPAMTFPPSPSSKSPAAAVITTGHAQLPRFLGGGSLIDTHMRLASYDLGAHHGNPFASSGDDTILSFLNSELFPSKKLVSEVFTSSMYRQLKEYLSKSGSDFKDLDGYWSLSKSVTFEDFVMHPQNLAHIQRLERQTSPFVGKFGPHMRPAATTCSEQLEMENVGKWFREQWMKYMFQVEASSPVSGQQGTIYGLTRGSRPCTGEALVALAVYDTMMMSILSEGGRGSHFREVRERQCTLLTTGAQKAFLDLLEEGKLHFRNVDAIILRNINADLAERIRESEFGRTQFELKVPRSFNKLTRDNPAILLRIGRFLGAQEVIIDAFEDRPEEFGRSFVCSATRLDTSQTLVLLASLGSREALELVHDDAILKGDTNRMLLAGMTSVASSDDKFLTDIGLSEVSNSLPNSDLKINNFIIGREQPLHSIVFQNSEYGGSSNETMTSVMDSLQQKVSLPLVRKPLIISLTKKEVTVKQRAAIIESIALKKLRKKDVRKEKIETKTPQTMTPVVVSPQPSDSVLMEDGIVELPSEGIGMSNGVAEGSLLPPSSQLPGSITVTVIADSTLSDRLNSIYSGLVLAHTLNANVHILWEINDRCPARFSVLFKLDGTHSCVKNITEAENMKTKLTEHGAMFDAVITAKHHRSTSHLIGGQEGCSDPPEDYLSSWHCGMPKMADPEDKKGQISQWTQKRKENSLRTHLLYHVNKLPAGISLKKVQAALKFYNFKLHDVLQQRITDFAEQHNLSPVDTVGVHLLSANVNDAITDVRLRFPQKTFFLASDNPVWKRRFFEEFPARTVLNTMMTYQSGNRNKTSNVESAVVDGLTDLALLSRTARPEIDGIGREYSTAGVTSLLCSLRLSCDEDLAKVAASRSF